MTPCYFSRLCGQRFRVLVNGKWESERSGGEERKREMYRQRDWEEERQGSAAVTIAFICTAVDAADCGLQC